MNNDLLSAAYRQATDACPLAGQGCPSANELGDAAAGRLSSERREALVAILANCARCAAAVQMAADLGQLNPSDGPQSVDERGNEAPSIMPPAPRRIMPGRRPYLRYASAASVVLVLAMASVWQLRPLAPEIQLRGDLPSVQPAHGSRLLGAPTQFIWPVPPEASCRIELRNAQGELQRQMVGLRGGVYRVDPPLTLAPGGYLWTAHCAAEVLGPFGFSVQ